MLQTAVTQPLQTHVQAVSGDRTSGPRGEVNGNHEQNAEWQPRVRELLPHATFLQDERAVVAGVEER